MERIQVIRDFGQPFQDSFLRLVRIEGVAMVEHTQAETTTRTEITEDQVQEFSRLRSSLDLQNTVYRFIGL